MTGKSQGSSNHRGGNVEGLVTLQSGITVGSHVLVIPYDLSADATGCSGPAVRLDPTRATLAKKVYNPNLGKYRELDKLDGVQPIELSRLLEVRNGLVILPPPAVEPIPKAGLQVEETTILPPEVFRDSDETDGSWWPKLKASLNCACSVSTDTTDQVDGGKMLPPFSLITCVPKFERFDQLLQERYLCETSISRLQVQYAQERFWQSRKGGAGDRIAGIQAGLAAARLRQRKLNIEVDKILQCHD